MSREHLTAFESMDRLLTVELRPRNVPTGFVPQLYSIARGDDEPLSYRIATELSKFERGRILIFTGVVIPPHLPLGEIDGPIGAIVLARSLSLLHHEVALVVESCQTRAAKELLTAVEIDGVSVLDVGTLGGEDADHDQDLNVAIAIEKISANRQGVRHSILGTPLDSLDPDTDGYFSQLLEHGTVTIGIGDGGNEIGFGKVHDDVRRILGRTGVCRCGCSDGIVAATPTTHLLPCAISNLGAYALAAALGLLFERPELCATPTLVSRLIDSASELGFLDGATLDPAFRGDDGVPLAAITAFVCILNEIVMQALREVGPRPF
jgi:D-glutamate cyclase